MLSSNSLFLESGLKQKYFDALFSTTSRILWPNLVVRRVGKMRSASEYTRFLRIYLRKDLSVRVQRPDSDEIFFAQSAMYSDIMYNST